MSISLDLNHIQIALTHSNGSEKPLWQSLAKEHDIRLDQPPTTLLVAPHDLALPYARSEDVLPTSLALAREAVGIRKRPVRLDEVRVGQAGEGLEGVDVLGEAAAEEGVVV
jgi:hypothetical protein